MMISNDSIPKTDAYENETTIYNVVKFNYIEYGKYVNSFRAIPHIMDGLKPVQRRVLISARDTAKKMCKTASVSGECLKKWHPHGDSSVNAVISSMVRAGLLDGQGQHGKQLLEFIPEAAPRYTEVKYREELNDILFGVKSSRVFFNELGNEEYVHLNTPVPFALVFGTTGIGVGTKTSIPAFSYKSILKAYDKNNPKLLKCNYGYKIVKADWDELWNDGKGCVTYTYEVSQQKVDGKLEFVIEGDGRLFTPNLNVFKEHEEQGRIYIRNESTKRVRIVIGRTKGIKLITDDELLDLCKKASIKTKSYIIRVNDEKCVRKIGIKEWLDTTMGNYTAEFDKQKESVISKLRNKIEEFNFINVVYRLLVQNKTDNEIAKAIKKEEEFVKSVLQKPLKLLRKNDFSSEINAIEKKILEVEKTNVNAVLRHSEKVFNKKC